jgi:hypothetical protein
VPARDSCSQRGHRILLICSNIREAL